jgi:beta-glucanase (GH16 family)
MALLLFLVTPVLFGQYTNWKLVWSDEFNGTAIDTNNWTYEQGAWIPSNELEYYTTRPENSRIENGSLVIEARREDYGGRQYTSARLHSKGKVEFQYGKVEAMIKCPEGQGIWPAFWMLGKSFVSDWVTPSGWPQCGEIDIMEMIGGGKGRDDRVFHTIHWDKKPDGHAYWGGYYDPCVGKFSEGYHKYTVEWDANQVRAYFDDNYYF